MQYSAGGFLLHKLQGQLHDLQEQLDQVPKESLAEGYLRRRRLHGNSQHARPKVRGLRIKRFEDAEGAS